MSDAQVLHTAQSNPHLAAAHPALAAALNPHLDWHEDGTPFPHKTANDVLAPWFFRELDGMLAHFRGVAEQLDPLHRILRSGHHAMPFRLFVSRIWHEFIADAVGVPTRTVSGAFRHDHAGDRRTVSNGTSRARTHEHEAVVLLFVHGDGSVALYSSRDQRVPDRVIPATPNSMLMFRTSARSWFAMQSGSHASDYLQVYLDRPRRSGERKTLRYSA